MPAIVVVRANDWRTIAPSELLERTRNVFGKRWAEDYEPGWRPENGLTLRELVHDQRVVGRLAFYKEHTNLAHGVLTIGGLRAREMHGVFGILAGASSTASRQAGLPVVAAEEARRWAKEQSEIVHLAYDDAEQQAQCTELAIHFGATVRTTPIARHLSRWMSLDDISEWATKQDVIKLVTEDGIWSMLHEKYDEPREWTPSPQLLTIPQRSTTVLDVGVNESWPSDSEDDATGAIIEVIAEAWKTTSGAIRKTMDSATVGERDGEPLSFRRVLVVERPVPP